MSKQFTPIHNHFRLTCEHILLISVDELTLAWLVVVDVTFVLEHFSAHSYIP